MAELPAQMSGTMATEYNSKDKWSSTIRSSVFGGFTGLEMRLVMAFQAGAAAAFVFMIIIFMQINYLWSSSAGGSVLKGYSSGFLRGSLGLHEWGLGRQPPGLRITTDLAPLTALLPRVILITATLLKLYGIIVLSNTRFPHDDAVIQGTAKNHYAQDLQIPTIAEYTTVVVHCAFESPVGLDGIGGQLRMVADHGEEQKKTPLGAQNVEFVAVTQDRGAYNATSFEAPFQYEYMYCGGPLYGSVNPHRLREWVAYHMRLFGENSHFIFYDNGGVNDESWRVLEPWVKLKRLTIMKVRQEARYDSYYHRQFLLTNDCLCSAKPLARWAFFFDIDEYLYVTVSPHLELSFHKVMSEMAERGRKATSAQFQQRIMSHALCVKNDSAPILHQSQWAMEKLVYQREVKAEERCEFSRMWGPLDDFKSAVQPKYVLVMGVHEPADVELSEGVTSAYYTCSQPSVLLEDKAGTFNSTGDKLVYYHCHGTTSLNQELCLEFVDPLVAKTLEYDGASFKYDNSMTMLVDTVKEYELKVIGTLQ